MKCKTRQWFLTTIKYDKMNEGGVMKKVTEHHAVAAPGFGAAETRIIDEMAMFCSGDFDIMDIKRAPFRSVFFTDSPSDDKYFRVKLKYITIDEKTEKEKKTTEYILVNASSVESAQKNINEILNGSITDTEVKAIDETEILDVFELEKDSTQEEN